jgi:hypothetical protein
MKKFTVIAPAFLAVIILIAPGINGMGNTPDKSVMQKAGQDHDTIGLLKMIQSSPFKLEIIPPSTGVQFYDKGIIFLSNTKYEGKMLPNHVSFGSIEAYTSIVKDTSLGMHLLFSPDESFSYPCEATTFTADYKTMYYTKISKKEKKEKIYKAILTAGSKGSQVWKSDESPLNFCSGNYLFTHPTVSSDGKMMVFASDMAGTNGGLDLFITRKEGDKWSAPQNLGKGFNTSKDECFPYIDNDNNLFYSSDGLAGYGGYDIFTCRFDGTGWARPVNLSKKINSENDDIAFVIDRLTGTSAFYTVRKKSGNSDMKLIRVSIRQNPASANPLTLSYIFNGKAKPATELIAAKPAEISQPPVNEPVITAKQDQPLKEQKEQTGPVKPEVKKESKPEFKAPPAETSKKPLDAKVVIIKNTSELPANLKDKVIYRVQFLSTGKQRKETTIAFNGTNYKTFEYFYLDLYRYTVGEFTTLTPAKELQDIVRKAGYDGAFVAAFKNDMRSLDLSLFK